MKKRILLIDESLTVQKVVALTLDKSRFSVSYSRSRAEAMKIVVDSPPELILVSDQVNDINVPSFPKEVEAWLGGEACPIVLITGQDIREARHYASVLKKPFSPQALLAIIDGFSGTPAPAPRRPVAAPAPAPAPAAAVDELVSPNDDFEDQRLQKAFNETFADEAKLTRETLGDDNEDDERTLLTIPVGWPPQSPPAAPVRSGGPEPGDAQWEERSAPAAPQAKRPRPASVPQPPAAAAGGDLWSAAQPGGAKPAVRPSRPQAASLPLESPTGLANSSEAAALESQLESRHWDEIVDRALAKILPPIVERLVEARLDKLMRDQEQQVEAKP